MTNLEIAVALDVETIFEICFDILKANSTISNQNFKIQGVSQKSILKK